MFDLHRHGPLAGCLLLSAAALLIPFKPSGISTPPPPPPPDTHTKADAWLSLGQAARVHAGVGQALLAPGVAQEVDLAFDVTGGEPAAVTGRAVVLCIDRSGSMHGGNMRKAKEAAAMLVSSLGPNDEIAIISFSTRPGVDLPLQRADDNGRRAALLAIDALEARGGTHLSGGLSLAVRSLGDSRLPVRRVVLLSDGVPTEGDVSHRGILGIGEDAARSGLVVSTFGVGSQSPGGLMERIAVAAGGNFRFLRDGSQLHAALRAELDATSRIAAQELLLRVDLPSGAVIRRVAGGAGEAGGRSTVIRMGDVVSGETRHVVVTVALPAAGVNRWDFPVHASARAGGVPLSAADTITAGTSTDAVAVERSMVPWVQAEAEVARAADEIRVAAKDYERGNSGAGARKLDEVASRMEKKAAAAPPAAAPALRAQATRLRALADTAATEVDTGAAANTVHQQAFDLMR